MTQGSLQQIIVAEAATTEAATTATTTTSATETTTSTAEKPQDPVQMLQDISNNVLNALRARKNSTDTNGVYSVVDKYILPYADFNEMSQWVAGRKIWTHASDKSRQAFMDAFKVLVVRTYATALNGYTNEKIQFNKQKIDLINSEFKLLAPLCVMGKTKTISAWIIV